MLEKRANQAKIGHIKPHLFRHSFAHTWLANGEFDLAVMDLSFISATKVMPAIVPLLKREGRMIVLIKPQFEVGRDQVERGGIVRDPQKHRDAIALVNAAAVQLEMVPRQVIESPVRGAKGNVEFLALYENARIRFTRFCQTKSQSASPSD